MSEVERSRRVAAQHTGALSALRWAVTRQPERWPRWIETRPGPTPPRRVESGLRYTVVNHSTVLLQIEGCNLITDPILSARCSPISWIGPRRVRAPGLELEQLPPIDAVLVSHNHYDHMDLPTLRQLWERDRPLFLVAEGDGPILRRRRIERVEEMTWWDECTVGDSLRVTYVPARHFSGRGATDRNRSLWGGYVVATDLGPVYFCGDSGYGPLFAEIGSRFGPPCLAFLPIGAYRPRWFMGPVHVDPREAAQIHLDLAARTSVAIHFGTFQLTDEGIDDPRRELEAARRALGIDAAAFRVPVFGEESWLEG